MVAEHVLSWQGKLAIARTRSPAAEAHALPNLLREYSTLDARQLGLNTHVIVDGCRGIDLEPGDIGRALDEMKRAGAVLLKSGEL
ncbi:MAG: hypothetical protein ACJ8LM_08300 [Candidatus Udaeobacter sp.]